MTCFWDGIFSALDNHDYALLKVEPPATIYALVTLLKSRNCLTSNLTQPALSAQQMEENFTAVRTYDCSTMPQGYLCSTCDYFLALIAEVFQVNIEHDFNGVPMSYVYAPQARKTLVFTSDTGHFQNVNAGMSGYLGLGLGLCGGAFIIYLLSRRTTTKKK
jgi:hypothetical protein